MTGARGRTGDSPDLPVSAPNTHNTNTTTTPPQHHHNPAANAGSPPSEQENPDSGELSVKLCNCLVFPCLHKFYATRKPNENITFPNTNSTANLNLKRMLKGPSSPQVNKGQTTINVTQINLHKNRDAWDSLVASVVGEKSPIILATEPYFNTDNTLPHIHEDLVAFFDTTCKESPRSAILVHKTLKDHCTINMDHSHRDQTLIHLKLKNDNLILLSTYMDGNLPVPPAEHKKAITLSTTTNHPIISGFDSNSHHFCWGSPAHKTDARGEDLLQYLDTNNLTIINSGTKPTYVNSRGHSSHIDITVADDRALPLVSDWHVSDEESGSDHRLIKFKINLTTNNQPRQTRNCKDTDWQALNDQLSNNPKLTNILNHPITTSSDLDQATEDLTNLVFGAFEESCPITYISSTIKKPPWLTQEVSDARAGIKHILKLRNNPKTDIKA